MATLSSLRSRRIANRKTEPTEKLVIFPVQQYWFAIPLEEILRVIPFNAAAIPADIVLINLSQQLFPEPEQGSLAQTISDFPNDTFSPDVTEKATTQSQCLILLQNPQGTLLGLILNSQPLQQRIPQSQFTALTPSSIPAQLSSFCLMTAQDNLGQQLFILDLAKIYLMADA